jgi:hypothetical protein
VLRLIFMSDCSDFLIFSLVLATAAVHRACGRSLILAGFESDRELARHHRPSCRLKCCRDFSHAINFRTCFTSVGMKLLFAIPLSSAATTTNGAFAGLMIASAGHQQHRSPGLPQPQPDSGGIHARHQSCSVGLATLDPGFERVRGQRLMSVARCNAAFEFLP